METYELHKLISNRKLFAAIKMRFDVEVRQDGEFIQTRTGKGYKWHNFSRRDAIKLGLPTITSVSIHGPMGHIFTIFDPALHQLVIDEIEAMVDSRPCLS